MYWNRRSLLTGIVIALLAANLVVGIIIVRRLGEPPPDTATVPFAREQARVVRVIDGDTVELDSGARVRYLGVDTPESSANQNLSSPEYFGPEAAAYNRDLVEGELVWLEADTTEEDDYGRLLRWVFLEDGRFVQGELVRKGYAFVNIIQPDDRYAGLLRDLERTARDERRGVWEQFRPIAGGSGDTAPTPANEATSDDETQLVATFTPAPAGTATMPVHTPEPAECDPALVEGAIGPEQTEAVLDQMATVVFEVVRTHNSGQAVFLNSHDPYEDHFYVVIFPDRWEDFPEPPETYLDGRCVAIVGRVQAYRGTPQIVLRDRSQIEILQ